jgi:hypothetical protein
MQLSSGIQPLSAPDTPPRTAHAAIDPARVTRQHRGTPEVCKIHTLRQHTLRRLRSGAEHQHPAHHRQRETAQQASIDRVSDICSRSARAARGTEPRTAGDGHGKRGPWR